MDYPFLTAHLIYDAQRTLQEAARDRQDRRAIARPGRSRRRWYRALVWVASRGIGPGRRSTAHG